MSAVILTLTHDERHELSLALDARYEECERRLAAFGLNDIYAEPYARNVAAMERCFRLNQRLFPYYYPRVGP